MEHFHCRLSKCFSSVIIWEIEGLVGAFPKLFSQGHAALMPDQYMFRLPQVWRDFISGWCHKSCSYWRVRACVCVSVCACACLWVKLIELISRVIKLRNVLHCKQHTHNLCVEFADSIAVGSIVQNSILIQILLTRPLYMFPVRPLSVSGDIKSRWRHIPEYQSFLAAVSPTSLSSYAFSSSSSHPSSSSLFPSSFSWEKWRESY